MGKFALSLSILVCGCGILAAQETSGFSASVGAGFTTPVGNFGSNLDTGWNVRASAGWNFTNQVGANLNFGFDHMGFNSSVVTSQGVGGGYNDVFSATLDPIIHLTPHGPVGLYITGGGGFFHDYQAFTNPGVAVVPGFFFPYVTPANIVVSSYSTNKPGIDAGAGIEFGHRWGGKFFAEARWDRIFLNNYHMDFVPVTFGFRK